MLWILNATSRLVSYINGECAPAPQCSYSRALRRNIALWKDLPWWQWQDGRLTGWGVDYKRPLAIYAPLFLGEGCFGKREFAGNLILPGVVEIFKGDVLAANAPLLLLSFSCSHCGSLQQQISWSASSSFHSTSSAIFESLSTTHHIRKTHHVIYVAEWLHCAVVLTSFKKIIIWEVVWLLNGSKNLMVEKGKWQTEQDWEAKGRSLWGGNSYQPSLLT